MAEVSVGDGSPRLIRYAEVPLPLDCVVDGAVVDRDAVRQAIAACVSDGAFKPSRTSGVVRVVVNVAGLRAIIREIEMPPVPDADLDSAVRLQALDIIPFPIDRTLISARTIGSVGPREAGAAPEGYGSGSVEMGTPPLNRILLAAAHRDLVEPLVDAVMAAGLVVDGVDLASSALVRTFVDPNMHSAAPEAIVSIGAELTTVVVHEGGEPTFVRTIAGGGGAVTRAIAAALDLPFQDAENLKLRLGATPGVTGGVPPEAVAAAREGSIALLSEIRSSVDYYSSFEGRSPVSRVVLTGGGAQLAGLLDRLSHQTTAEVVAGAWVERVDVGIVEIPATRLETFGAVVVGLALPEPAGRKRLDLAPPEVVKHWRQSVVERWFARAAVLIVVLLVAAGALRYDQVHRAESDVTSLNGEILVLRAQIPKYDLVAQQDAKILSDEGIGEPLVANEVNWPEVYADLVKYTPTSVSASGLSATSSIPAVATTASTTTGASSTPPSSTATIATVNLSYTAPGFPTFQSWFDEVLSSSRLEIENYSGVQGTNASASTGISYSAQLGVTGLVQSSRLKEFEVSQP